MRRVLGCLAGLVVLTAGLVEPAAAARRSTLTNVSDSPVRICLTAVGCSKSTILLKPGRNSRQVLGTKKLRALYVAKGWRVVVVTKGQRVAYRGPVTVRRRGNSVVRIAWEAKIRDWRWGSTAANAPTFRAAFRRVAQTMKKTAPSLVIDFGVNCGSGLPGSADRTAPLTRLYPGDDVVDVIHCDVYDWWTARVRGADPTPL